MSPRVSGEGPPRAPEPALEDRPAPVRGPSIQWRIVAWLVPLLALAFAAVLFWLSTVSQNALYENNLEVVRRSTSAAARSIEESMLGERDAEHPWDRLTRRAVQEGAWIRIIGSDGELAYTSDPVDAEGLPGLEHPTCAPCHEGGLREVPDMAIVPGPAGESYQVLALPLPNRAECRTCHATRKANVGIVLVGQSVEPIHRVVGTIRWGIAVAGVLSLIVTLVTTRVVLGRLLGKPLRKLVDTAKSIGAGELDQRVDLEDRTELTVLADALNLSTSRLAEMVRRVERQRDEYGTLYHFTDQIGRAVRPDERRLRAVELATQFLGAECVLVQAAYRPESQTGEGTITLRGADEFEDQPFRFGPDSQEGIPPFLGRVIERWLKGEFDDTSRIEEGWIVGYPVQHEGRHLGLLLLPAAHGDEPESEPPDPELVQALCRHIAIALVFSEMQNELVAQERLAAIGETIAGMAHCLKNSLNALRAGLYITDRALVREDPKKLHRGWSITKVGIRQIEALSLDMLYYVKRRRPNRAEIDPNVIIGDVVELLRETAAEKGVTIRAETDEKVGTELLDRTTIYRAILNLATNAIDACTESETAGDRVVIRSRAEPDAVVLTVEDNGIGMSEDVRSQLFTRFFTTKPGKGTGLGLPVVKKIVEEHGGTVEIESEPGRGTAFHLHLPRHPDQRK